MIKIYFLAENKTDRPPCSAEHGLSVYIKTGDKNILFDTGASDMFAANASLMGVDIAEADMCVISHGHYDHTGGVPAFCRLNDRAPVFIHKNAFKKTYGFEKGSLEPETTGIRWTDREYEELLPRMIFTKGVLKVSEDIVISGTIPDIAGYLPTELFYEKTAGGELTPDNMDHEQFLIIRDRDENGKSNGLYIFSGCSHKGVIPVIRYAKEIFPDEKIRCLAAGMHLYSASDEDRQRVVKEVLDEHIEMVMPVHCTGIDAICDLRAAMGKSCVVAYAGACYEY